jgi:hypothetical protein
MQQLYSVLAGDRWDNLRVRKSTKEKLQQLYETRKHELLDRNITSLSGMVEDVLMDVIEANEIWRSYTPYLELDEIADDSIVIKDNKARRLIRLVLKNGDLYCEHDRKFDCAHIGFAWSKPQVYKIMKAHGSKMP